MGGLVPNRAALFTSLVGLCVVALAPALQAQTDDWLPEAVTVEPVASLRLRSWVDLSPDLSASDQPALSLPILGRLGAQLNVGTDYSGRLVLGSQGVLASTAQPTVFVDEAYLDATTRIGPGLARLRMGRQGLRWGQGRLLSEEDFAARPRRLDALRISAALSQFELDVFVAQLGAVVEEQARGTLLELDQKDQLGGARLSWSPQQKIGVAVDSMLFLLRPLQATDLIGVEGDQRQGGQVFNLGVDVNFAPWAWLRLDWAGSLQMGEFRGLAHSAYDLSVASTLSSFWDAGQRLHFGYDLASGDGHSLDNRSTAFINPLGERHQRFGLGDFLGNSNTADLWVGLLAQRSAGQVAITLHRLALSDAQGPWVDATGQVLAGPSQDLQDLLGYGVDLHVEAVLATQISVELTYAMFVPSVGAAQRLGDQVAHRLVAGLAFSY